MMPHQPLTTAQIEHFRTEGYLIVPQVFSPREMQALGDDVERVCHEHADILQPHNMRVRFKTDVETNTNVFDTLDPIADLSPVARSVARDPRIYSILHDLYGEPACLFKEKLIYKRPRSTGADLHQDWVAWERFPESFLSVIVAIDPFTADSGATEVFPRCHRRGYMSTRDGGHHLLQVSNAMGEPITFTTDTGERHAFPECPGAVPLVLNPGDIAIFICMTPHRSAPNLSNTSRRGYFISYTAESDGGEFYDVHYRDFHEWIRAKTPPEKRERLYFR